MANDVKSDLPLEPDLKLEIAHILLIDVVGFSRLLANDQVKIIKELNSVVRATECFRKAEEAGKLIRLPTGDGMMLLFFESPEEPVRCAVEISGSLRRHPEIQVRMGIHSGPVNQVPDVNDRPNFAGAGINIAQRVMDCADAGHILVSQHVAGDLDQYAEWRSALHPLGECEVKHGYRLHIVNLWKDGIGNPAVPEKLRRRKRWRQDATRQSSAHAVEAPRWPLLLVTVAALLSIVAVGITLWMVWHSPQPLRNVNQLIRDVIPEKSIAVLPFENLSDQKQDAYFADGVQDQILTDLAKAAALKVISRTSVMQYREGTKPRNLREIGKALGVAYALEGTVRRVGLRVRVTAQLIDARSDAHVWAEQYDREIVDVFALQSEIAEKISAQLNVTIAPNEMSAIQEKPTNDLVAFDLYIRAKDLIESAVLYAPRDEKLNEAVRLLEQATGRDPSFALAYFQLSHAHDQIYFEGGDHSPQRLQKSEAAIHALARLRPESGEAHLAEAKHRYFGYFDYDGARRELAAVDGKLPNDPWPFVILGYVDRRQGKWEQSTYNLERALQLDPRNYAILNQIAISYEDLSRYRDAIATLDRVLEIAPDDIVTKVTRENIQLEWHANPKPVHDLLANLLSEDPARAPVVADRWLFMALCERDYVAAERAVAVLTPDGCRHEGFPFPLLWCQGIIAKAQGDESAARTAFLKARENVASIVHEQPGYAEAICTLGVLDAAVGNKESAIKNGQLAIKLFAPSGNAIEGAVALHYLALIYAWTGEKDAALKTLAEAVRTPGSVSFGELRLHPFWDPLRGDPKFEKIVASLAPKQ
ncbi:MAG TPA: tetratricopeptide repeat protein [Chthoniobacterales bacterium]|nr:tetratricopeptide repeat protein [Chthoniobacterales bacterium]